MISIGEINLSGIAIGETLISKVCLGEYEIWGGASRDYSLEYLTFKILTDGTLSWKTYQSYSKTIYYSINNGEWIAWTSSADGSTINVYAGDEVRLKGINQNYATSKQKYNCFEGGTATFNVYGNIMSLLYGDDFIGNITLPSTFEFCSLFKYTNVISAEHLILPAKQLSNYCYRAMFSFATLQVAPALPATTLSQGCYWYMFEQCPITTAPDLLAATVPAEAYGNMFNGCSSLNYIKCLATDISADSAVTNWTTGVSTNGTFVKDPDMASWGRGTSGIPTKWTIQDFDYATEFFHYNIISDNTELFIDGESVQTLKPFNIYYSTDKVIWNKLSLHSGETFSLGTYNRGENVYIKSKNLQGYGLATYEGDYGYNFYASDDVNVRGNILSLTLGDKFYDPDNLYYDDNYYGVFAGLFAQGNIVNAEKLYLPYVGKGGFYSMFAGCTGMIYAPPFIFDSAKSSFEKMFYGCNSLLTTPEHINPNPSIAVSAFKETFENCENITGATIDLKLVSYFSNESFYGTFSGCTALEDVISFEGVPTLGVRCFAHMYEGCTSLVSTIDLPSTTLSEGCYESMFEGCTGLVNIMEKLPSGTLAIGCYKSMFNGCTNITESPILPARTLVENCYKDMFNGCTSLNYIECYATNTGATDCTENWVNNVSSTGTFVKNGLMNSWTVGVDGIPINWTVEDAYDYKGECLTFEVLTGGTIKWSHSNTIFGSVNNGEWFYMSSGIEVNSGDKVRFKGNNPVYGKSTPPSTAPFGGTASFNIYGNILSLVGLDNFENITYLNNYAFNSLFRGINVVDASNLYLPDFVSVQCYQSMFQKCQKLIAAPVLPAMSLAYRCYHDMFNYCTALTAAPELPAMQLAQGCYEGMFYDCTGLTIASELPATALTTSCYQNMYNNSGILESPVLAATSLADSCYKTMFCNCKNIKKITCLATNTSTTYFYRFTDGVATTDGLFVKNPNATWSTGGNGIPNGWTVVDYVE